MVCPLKEAFGESRSLPGFTFNGQGDLHEPELWSLATPPPPPHTPLSCLNPANPKPPTLNWLLNLTASKLKPAPRAQLAGVEHSGVVGNTVEV